MLILAVKITKVNGTISLNIVAIKCATDRIIYSTQDMFMRIALENYISTDKTL